MQIIGEFTCPHEDGDYQLTVTDLINWSTGFCTVTQKGQDQQFDIVLSKKEAGKLAKILIEFAMSK
jgi:hypothetical protein